MKKFLSAGLSIATAVLTFVFLSIPCLSYSLADKKVQDWNGWQILSDYTSEVNGFTLYQIFVIAAMVFAGLIIIVSLLMLLQQLNIVKAKTNFGFINSMLLILYTITALVAMIGVILIGKELSVETLKSVFQVNMGLIFPWIIGLVVTGVSFVLNRNSK